MNKGLHGDALIASRCSMPENVSEIITQSSTYAFLFYHYVTMLKRLGL